MEKIRQQVCLVVRAKENEDTMKAITYGWPLTRIWISFDTFKEAQRYKPDNGIVVAIVPPEIDPEKL